MFHGVTSLHVKQEWKEVHIFFVCICLKLFNPLLLICITDKNTLLQTKSYYTCGIIQPRIIFFPLLFWKVTDQNVAITLLLQPGILQYNKHCIL